MSKHTHNEALKAYKSLQSAKRARVAYKSLHKRACSDIFKHVIADKRVKQKERYAFIVDVKELASALTFFQSIDELF